MAGPSSITVHWNSLFCLSDLRRHHRLLLLLLHVDYIQIQRSDKFHELKIKTKRILGLKPIQMHASTNNYDVCTTERY